MNIITKSNGFQSFNKIIEFGKLISNSISIKPFLNGTKINCYNIFKEQILRRRKFKKNELLDTIIDLIKKSTFFFNLTIILKDNNKIIFKSLSNKDKNHISLKLDYCKKLYDYFSINIQNLEFIEINNLKYNGIIFKVLKNMKFNHLLYENNIIVQNNLKLNESLNLLLENKNIIFIMNYININDFFTSIHEIFENYSIFFNNHISLILNNNLEFPIFNNFNINLENKLSIDLINLNKNENYSSFEKKIINFENNNSSNNSKNINSNNNTKNYNSKEIIQIENFENNRNNSINNNSKEIIQIEKFENKNQIILTKEIIKELIVLNQVYKKFIICKYKTFMYIKYFLINK
jgi:hypothetical protein